MDNLFYSTIFSDFPYLHHQCILKHDKMKETVKRHNSKLCAKPEGVVNDGNCMTIMHKDNTTLFPEWMTISVSNGLQVLFA